jgi:hypothetical protein
MIYKGWTITYSGARAVTGSWRADRFGVGVCASTKAALLRMIDIKNYERLERDKTRPEMI